MSKNTEMLFNASNLDDPFSKSRDLKNELNNIKTSINNITSEVTRVCPLIGPTFGIITANLDNLIKNLNLNRFTISDIIVSGINGSVSSSFKCVVTYKEKVSELYPDLLIELVDNAKLLEKENIILSVDIIKTLKRLNG